jgi:hypothetical protein
MAKNGITKGKTPNLTVFYMTMERAALEYEMFFPGLSEYLKDIRAASLNGQNHSLDLLLNLSHLSLWTTYDNPSPDLAAKIAYHYAEHLRPFIWGVLENFGLTLASCEA